jgi:hypothetical protein
MRTKPEQLTVTNEGFSFSGQLVRWSDVMEIVGFKVDRLTTDEIRLSFRGPNGQRLAEISEEQPGFDAVSAEMTARFPSTSQWHASLAKPAFAKNETILYRRP